MLTSYDDHDGDDDDVDVDINESRSLHYKSSGCKVVAKREKRVRPKGKQMSDNLCLLDPGRI